MDSRDSTDLDNQKEKSKEEKDNVRECHETKEKENVRKDNVRECDETKEKENVRKEVVEDDWRYDYEEEKGKEDEGYDEKWQKHETMKLNLG